MTENSRSFHERTLIGRDGLLAELMAHVAAQRLLTLTGPGGVGKTSIAQHLAARLDTAARFGDGVRWVDLAALAPGAAVLQALARACGIAERRDLPWIATLIGALQSTQTLLVLDNCEHLRAECAGLSEQLLAACPGLQILTTSREPLGLPAEQCIPIPPLDGAAAAALFGLRAAAHLPSFVLSADTVDAIAAICRQLDGVPLAIELAAARVTLLSVAQIAERMERSLSVLASRKADRPLRQRSLRAVLDWSYVLLLADEQTLLGQLAVFAGSFDFAAVEAVCLVAAPLDALAELVDKSLVQATQHAATVRYHLHEVVRQYAAERLEQSQAQGEIRLRQLAWIIALAERAEADFNLSREHGWIDRLLLEHENIRSALRTADDRGDAGGMLQLASALAHFWNSVSLSEGRAWLGRGRALAPVQPGIVSVKAWNSESFLAYRQGDYDGMQLAATAALEEALRIEYAEGIAAARYRLGIYAEMKGATAEAREQYTQSLELLQELGDRRAMRQTLNGLAHVAKIEGNGGAAREYYRQGLELARADNDRLTIALLLISLANLTLEEGDLEAAEAAYAESIVHLDAVKNTSYILYAVNGLGEIAHHRQQYAGAIERYQEGLRLARALGLKDMEAQFLGHLGRTMTAQGDYPEAAQCLSAALRLHRELERPMRIAVVVLFCAELALRRGYPTHATSLFVAGLCALAAEDFSQLGAESAALDMAFKQAQAALEVTERALAAADGQALTLAQAADLALAAVFLPLRPLSAEPAPELRIFLLGQLRVERAGRELSADDWVYAKTKDLLLFLLMVESADKAEIGAALWPDASAEQLKQNFRVAIYHLRRALGRTEWITFSGGRYAFNHTLAAWIDVVAFERAVELARSDPARRSRQLRTAAALYTGDLAGGDLASDMLPRRRERLHQQALEAMLALGALHEDRGQHGRAAETYRRALALDSYSEAAHRGLMRSLARQGEGGAALVHYDRCVELLAQELGLAPMPETALLAAQIQAGSAV